MTLWSGVSASNGCGTVRETDTNERATGSPHANPPDKVFPSSANSPRQRPLPHARYPSLPLDGSMAPKSLIYKHSSFDLLTVPPALPTLESGL